jgi:hypothetical protein
MGKAVKTTTVKTNTVTLTMEQYAVLFKVRSLLDNASDTLDAINGDENAFAIGRMVGDACSDIVNAFNDLGDLVDETNPNDLSEDDFEFEAN